MLIIISFKVNHLDKFNSIFNIPALIIYNYEKLILKIDNWIKKINKKELIKKIKKNFKIIYCKEAKGFSKFKNEDPCLIRIIAINKLIKI